MSLVQRLLFGAGAVLIFFVILTSYALERAFYDSALSARQERLLGQLYLLIGVAEVDEKGQLRLPLLLSESRFDLPHSGLYAQVINHQQQPVWHSPSAVGEKLPRLSSLPPAKQQFNVEQTFFTQSMGLTWLEGGKRYAFTFHVIEDKKEFDTQIAAYRRTLWGWLLGLATLLLLAQVLLLRWGLLPLRHVSHELNAIEKGQQENITGNYPVEINRLTDSLNSFIAHERTQQTRYRNALADLAHSLKTPLAVMKGALSGDGESLRHTINEQVGRMDSIVTYQLQRAATAGASHHLGKQVEILPIVQKITGALSKVHRDKNIQLLLSIQNGVCFAGDEGDLMEMMGNLLENAYKWARHEVQVVATVSDKKLMLQVADDGAGIPPEKIELILQRGVRADEAVPGHGIGLAVVRDIVDAYQGKLLIGKSEMLGGAEFRVLIG